MRWYLDVLTKKYLQFDGRARRTEYWMFTLFNVIALVVLAGLGQASSMFMVLYGLYALATLLPALGVSVRRLHDTGRSGLWMLIALVPVIGGLVLLWFMVQPGQQGKNAFGPDPKEGAAAQPAPAGAPAA